MAAHFEVHNLNVLTVEAGVREGVRLPIQPHPSNATPNLNLTRILTTPFAPASL